MTHNPNPADKRALLADSQGGTNYDSAHSRVHPALQVLAQSADFEDIYLFDNDGNAIYTVNKGDDFAGAFGKGGSFAGTVLGKLVGSLKDDQTTVSMSDIATYAPAGGEATVFMAAPVLYKTGARAGSIAVRLPIATFGTLINRRDGLGQSGEVLIVGTDHLLRNDSSFTSVPDVLKTEFDDPIIESALGGMPAHGTVSGWSRDEAMLADAVPLTSGAQQWAVVTMISAAEATAPVSAMGQAMLISAILLMFLAGIIAWFMSRRVTKPITRLTGTMASLARGDLAVEVPYAAGRDEIGDMARAVEVFRANGLKVAELTDAEAGRAERDRTARARMMSDLQAAFGNVVEAATAGDFTRRVETRFADAELNTLAEGINEVMRIYTTV